MYNNRSLNVGGFTEKHYESQCNYKRFIRYIYIDNYLHIT